MIRKLQFPRVFLPLCICKLQINTTQKYRNQLI